MNYNVTKGILHLEMTTITQISLEQQAEWDALVKSFDDYDVYYLNGYAKSFWLHGDGDPILIYMQNDHMRFINVTMKRDIADDAHFQGKLARRKYFDFKTPYGYGGPLVEGVFDDESRRVYHNWCKEQGVVCEVVKFHPLLRNWERVSGYNIDNTGVTVYMDLSSPENIYQNCKREKRNRIRKARNNGLIIEHGRSEELVEKFIEIYEECMKRLNANQYYFFNHKSYWSIFNDLPENSVWFYAKNDTEICAVVLFLIANGMFHYHLSASTEYGRKYNATDLLTYEAALWAEERDFKYLHLGGGNGAQKDELYRYKKGFYYHGDDLPFCIGTAVFDPIRYDELNQMRASSDGTLPNMSYVPSYRL